MATRFRELRIEKNMTQMQLGIALDVTQETISAYESGKNMPTVSSLMKMSDLFGASMDYIMGRTDVRNTVPDLGANPQDAIMREQLMNCYRRLGSRNKARLQAYAQGLLDSEAAGG